MKRLVVLGFLAVMALASPRGGDAALTPEQRNNLSQAVVMVVAADVLDGEPRLLSSGSGTVITSDGAILTNDRVVWNEEKSRVHDEIYIAAADSPGGEPAVVCRARGSTVLVRRESDLALVKCETDLIGRPLRRSWPIVPVGSSAPLLPGHDIHLLGYPGSSGSSFAGQVTGFQGDEGGAGRQWIKTSAAINQANAGGAAVNSAGELVGVPSVYRRARVTAGDSMGTVGLVRPIEAAAELIELARSGWQPGDPVLDSTGLPASNPGPPPPVSRGVVVTGRVEEASGGAPIPGALVIVLRPGTRASAVTRQTLPARFLTTATTGSDGRFRSEAPVPRGETMAVLVVASGYRTLVADEALVTTKNPPAVFQPWPPIRLQPE